MQNHKLSILFKMRIYGVKQGTLIVYFIYVFAIIVEKYLSSILCKSNSRHMVYSKASKQIKHFYHFWILLLGELDFNY